MSPAAPSTPIKSVSVGKKGVQPVVFANNKPFSLISGTCAVEGRDITLKTAEKLAKICQELNIGLVYKGSFDKANRSSGNTQRGIGMEESLKILAEVRSTLGLPVLTDVHETTQVEEVAGYVDILQIPAFLSRQTDLITACAAAAVANPGLALNIKKGQFMAPLDMHGAAAKAVGAGTEAILLTERGTTFGYNNLVVDYRSFPLMAGSGFPVIHDATHSIQMPGAMGDSSGGDRRFLPTLARAAVAAGVAGIFMESHPNPAEAMSDKLTQWPLAEAEALLTQLKELDNLAKEQLFA